MVQLRQTVTELDHTLGSKNAPVTLLEYGNFECLDCGRAYPFVKDIQRTLGDNLRFVFRHFPTVRTHPHAIRAAEAAEAAAEQGKFWEMHDELFTHQQALEDKDLARYARRIGLNSEKFAQDMAEHTFLTQIQMNYQLALFDEHITGTPTFYINDSSYTGATDVVNLLAAIKQADTENRIRLPESAGGIRSLLDRLRRRARSARTE
jgi:protein-disulfide isomerase